MSASPHRSAHQPVHRPTRPSAHPEFPSSAQTFASGGESSAAAAELARLPHGTRDWKRVLACLVTLRNRTHALREKRISFKTMEERSRFLFRFFEELRSDTPYSNIDPRCLKPKHIQAMVDRWVARDLSVGTIHNYISYLHTFAGWIDKEGLVLPVEFYVGAGSHLARRSEVATRDKSWSGNGVDFAFTLERIRQRCPYVAIEIEFARAFGLRAKEAIRLRPHEAAARMPEAPTLDEGALEPAEPGQMDGTVGHSDRSETDAPPKLHLRHGTKGGRKRDVAIESEAQRGLVARAQAMVAVGQPLARPGYTLKQNLQHYFDVLKAIGVTQAQLGVTGHGLRHQRAGEAYSEVTDMPSPVQGGSGVDRQLDRVARDRVAAMLGHGRRAVVSCYLGQSATSQGHEWPTEIADGNQPAPLLEARS